MKTLFTLLLFLSIFYLNAQSFKIAANEDAKGYAKSEILINAKSDKVYSILKDIKNWPKWKPECLESSIKGDMNNRAKFDYTMSDFKIKAKVHTYNSPSEFGLTLKKLVAKATMNWYLEEVDDKTKVTLEESADGPIPQDLIEAMPDIVDANLYGLKKQVEK
jgi:hypothetical protein